MYTLKVNIKRKGQNNMSILAEKFKLKRKELNLSQKELCDGICGQSQLSKIERGTFMPSAEMLFQFAQRLDVPLDYFFYEHIELKSNITNFKQLATKLLEDRNYNDLEYLYQLEQEKAKKLSSEDRTYLNWVKAIINFYKYDNKNSAIATLESSLQVLSPNSMVHLKILNTLSNFYSLVNRDDDYEKNYLILRQAYDNKDLAHQEYLFGYIRVRYNHAHYLISKKRNFDAIQEALETIDICKKWQTTYQLAPLLIIVGNAGEKLLSIEERQNYYLEAKEICKLFGNKLMLMKINEYLQNFDKDNH